MSNSLLIYLVNSSCVYLLNKNALYSKRILSPYKFISDSCILIIFSQSAINAKYIFNYIYIAYLLFHQLNLNILNQRLNSLHLKHLSINHMLFIINYHLHLIYFKLLLNSSLIYLINQL